MCDDKSVKSCKCNKRFNDSIGHEIKVLNQVLQRKLIYSAKDKGVDKLTLMHGWIIAYLYDHRDEDVYQKDIENAFSIARSTVTSILKLLLGDALADDVGLAGGDAGLRFLKRQVAAGIVRAVELAGILGALRLFAEAVIGAAALDEQLGVFAVGVAALGLDVGSHGTADVGAFVVVESALGQRAVDDVGRALDEAALVGILDAEDEGAARVARDEPGVERGAQVADVHIAGGGGSEARADLAVRDLRLHLVEVRHIKGHGVTS